ncbi:uncharacterized protein LOC131173209 [Hevea brasiliensis]|uniref:uncharacterized protein LOC131173209 n=1 Tax=Hevea brasiliensis TaxID=3981 RepID=UPI0025F14025|nr:uncharacterized protein LOC131173209 [Hevea brasiliensis]
MDYHLAQHHRVALQGMLLLIPKVKEMVILVSKGRLTKSLLETSVFTIHQLVVTIITNQGMQSDNGSLVCYLPRYNPYASGTVVGVDGQSVSQQANFSSPGYLPHPFFLWIRCHALLFMGFSIC